MRFRFVSVALTTLAIIPFIAFAHTSGASYEEAIGEYKIDIGYDPMSPAGGDRLVFDFATLTRNDAQVEFDYVWVRIEDSTRTILATGVARAEFGPTSLLYSLPDDLEGEIRVHARYQRGDDVLAEAQFPIQIARSADVRRALRNRILIDGLVILFAISALCIAVRYRYAKR